MRLVKRANTNRRGSTHQLEKIMAELKERQQKRVIQARINKEEALK